MVLRVLVVDDSRTSQRLIKNIVECAGFEVVSCCGDGFEALAKYKETKPDLVLLDITMPNMSGKECLVEIRKIEPNAKVIMVSALSDPILTQECIDLGALAFVSKSKIANPEDMWSELNQALKKTA